MAHCCCHVPTRVWSHPRHQFLVSIQEVSSREWVMYLRGPLFPLPRSVTFPISFAACFPSTEPVDFHSCSGSREPAMVSFHVCASAMNACALRLVVIHSSSGVRVIRHTPTALFRPVGRYSQGSFQVLLLMISRRFQAL